MAASDASVARHVLRLANWLLILGAFGPKGALAVDTPRAAASDSRAAFLSVYPVFQHPRCLNCHPSGEAPLQGDDSRPHAFRVRRGPTGSGLPAMRCTSCHQAVNRPEPHAPPGAADWQLPGPPMRMEFEGRSAGDLCRQLKDPKLNGGRTKEKVLEHLDTELVRWSWDPGPLRTTPPLSYEAFVARMKEWVAKGAACPE